MQNVAPQIYHSINNADRILVISHIDPDGDALGASLALSLFLDKINKSHLVFNYSELASYFDFLPKFENIKKNDQNINLLDHDLVITLDCGDLARTGIKEQLEQTNHYILINIDHHISNNYYGHHNLVLPQASSTSEILYKFFNFHQLEIDRNIATCLLCGILTDTSNFTNSSTTDESLKIASQLLKCGAKITQITNAIIKNKKINTLKFWGEIFNRLQLNKEYGIGFTVIKKEDFDNFDLEDESTEGLANFLNSLSEVKAILILQEKNDGIIKGSFRTTRDDIDVSALAAKFGGGGHRKAAGFKINGHLLETPNGWQVV